MVETGDCRMLLGTFKNRRLRAGRLSVPNELRSELEEGFVMTRGLDGCVAVFPRPKWEELVQRIEEGTSFLRESARLFQRHTYGDATVGGLDSEGQMKVPKELQRYAKLQDEVVIVGIATRLEIWNPEHWKEQESTIEEQAEEASEVLSECGV